MKLIEIPHKTCAFNCMWNVVEDQYTWRTRTIVPDYLFFTLSGIGNFAYIKNKKLPAPKTTYWSNGLTKKMYDFMGEIVGFEFIVKGGRSFSYSFKKAKEYIDNGVPVILDVDMYHLPYFEKFYHRIHIPIHHILMVGYDDDKNEIIILDGDRREAQQVSYNDLEKAWGINVPGFSKNNTFYVINFKDIKDLKTIVYNGLKKKVQLNLNPPVSFLGIKGIRKLSQEFSNWEKELSQEEYEKSLLHLLEYSGYPPILPKELSFRSDRSNEAAIYMGGRNVLSKTLELLSVKYSEPMWKESAQLFYQSGKIIEKLTQEITKCLLRKKKIEKETIDKLKEIADTEEKAYQSILSSTFN